MKLLKRIMLFFIIIIGVLCIGTFLFMQQAVFGKDPDGARLERIKTSSHYKNGSFVNKHDTPMLSADASYPKMLFNFFLGKPKNAEPDIVIPSVQTDLKSLKEETPVIVWFGHSSYLIKINGKNFLMDPVLSGNASPVSFVGKSYPVLMSIAQMIFLNSMVSSFHMITMITSIIKRF